MTKKDVVVGGIYSARISQKFVEIMILSTHTYPGRKFEFGYSKARTYWTARNLSTGREVTIKSAAKLRRRIA